MDDLVGAAVVDPSDAGFRLARPADHAAWRFCGNPHTESGGRLRFNALTSSIVTVVVTLIVALQLAAAIDVALMPSWAWRAAADARKRRWMLQLSLLPGWAVVYYRSADRREVRAHLFRCGGVEPEWQASSELETRAVSRVEGTVAVMKQRRLIREVIADAQSHRDRVAATAAASVGAGAAASAGAIGGSHGALAPIRWRADTAAMTQLLIALRAGALPDPRANRRVALVAGASGSPDPASPPAISWRAPDSSPRALPAAPARMRLTA